MRDLVAALIALGLLALALALAGALHVYRRRRRAARLEAESLGRAVVAELPLGPDLTLVTEDAAAFYYGERRLPKHGIRGARLLINGAVVASCESPGAAPAPDLPPVVVRESLDGIPRDRWDVVVYAGDDVILIECGAIRERVSQELARRIFDAIRRGIEAPGS